MKSILSNAILTSLFMLFVLWIVMVLSAFAYGDYRVGHTRGGISPSEFSEPFRWIALIATGTGASSLFVIVPGWIFLYRRVQHQAAFLKRHKKQIRRSIIWLPLLVTLVIAGGFVIHIATGEACFLLNAC